MAATVVASDAYALRSQHAFQIVGTASSFVLLYLKNSRDDNGTKILHCADSFSTSTLFSLYVLLQRTYKFPKQKFIVALLLWRSASEAYEKAAYKVNNSKPDRERTRDRAAKKLTSNFSLSHAFRQRKNFDSSKSSHYISSLLALDEKTLAKCVVQSVKLDPSKLMSKSLSYPVASRKTNEFSNVRMIMMVPLPVALVSGRLASLFFLPHLASEQRPTVATRKEQEILWWQTTLCLDSPWSLAEADINPESMLQMRSRMLVTHRKSQAEMRCTLIGNCLLTHAPHMPINIRHRRFQRAKSHCSVYDITKTN